MQIGKSRKAITGLLVSLLILILLFVGVSTATYAWYSAINRAVGDSISFTSSTQDQMGGDLAIGWTNTSSLNALTFDTPQSNLYPMIPISQPVIDITTYSQFVNNNFNFSAQRYSEALEQWICSFSGQSTTPYVCTVSDNSIAYQYFYIINKKTTEKQTVNIKYTITGDLADALRVAVFIGDSESGNTDAQNLANLRLVGILANTETIYYKAIEENDIVNQTPVMSDVYRASSSISFLLNESSFKCCVMVAWLDGVIIDNDNESQTTGFNITFDGVVAT